MIMLAGKRRKMRRCKKKNKQKWISKTFYRFIIIIILSFLLYLFCSALLLLCFVKSQNKFVVYLAERTKKKRWEKPRRTRNKKAKCRKGRSKKKNNYDL